MIAFISQIEHGQWRARTVESLKIGQALNSLSFWMKSISTPNVELPKIASSSSSTKRAVNTGEAIMPVSRVAVPVYALSANPIQPFRKYDGGSRISGTPRISSRILDIAGGTKIFSGRVYRQRQIAGARATISEASTNSKCSTKPFRILISTGDVMGDIHGAALIHTLLEEAIVGKKIIEIYAIGGQRMKNSGAILIGDNTGLSSIGLLEAVPLILPSIQLQQRVRTFLRGHGPDIVVLIDYPGVNIPFGTYVKSHFGCKVVYYIPPNEWLWSTSRTQAIVDTCDAILTVYPGEAEYYQNAGGRIVEVGHPLIDLFNPVSTRQQARRSLEYNERDLVILLMPASRSQEIRHVWPIIASAASLLLERVCALDSDVRIHFIVPSILPGESHIIEEGFQEFGLTGHASLWQGDPQIVMSAADLAITKSGSVNLELALHKVPQVVVYKIDKVTAWIARAIFKFAIKHVSLVNLVLQEKVVPEFIQEEAVPVNVAEAAFGLLSISGSIKRENVLDGYIRLRPLLGKPGVVQRTAQFILGLLPSDR